MQSPPASVHALDLPDELWLEIFALVRNNDYDFFSRLCLEGHRFYRFRFLPINRRLYLIHREAYASHFNIHLTQHPASTKDNVLTFSSEYAGVTKRLTEPLPIMAEVLPHVRHLALRSECRSNDENGRFSMPSALTSIHRHFPRLRSYSLGACAGSLTSLFDAPSPGKQLPSTLTQLSLYFTRESGCALISGLSSMEGLRRLTLWSVKIDGDLKAITTSQFTTNLVELELCAINASIAQSLVLSAPSLQILTVSMIQDPQEIPLFGLLPTSLKILTLGFDNRRHLLAHFHVARLASAILKRSNLPALEEFNLLSVIYWHDSYKLTTALGSLLSALPQIRKLSVCANGFISSQRDFAPNIFASLAKAFHSPDNLPNLRVLELDSPLNEADVQQLRNWPRKFKRWPPSLTSALLRRNLTNALGNPWTQEYIW